MLSASAVAKRFGARARSPDADLELARRRGPRPARRQRRRQVDPVAGHRRPYHPRRRRDRLSRRAPPPCARRATRCAPASPSSCRRPASRPTCRCSRTSSCPSSAGPGGCPSPTLRQRAQADPRRARPRDTSCRSTSRCAGSPPRSASSSRSPRRWRSTRASSSSTSRPPRSAPSEVDRLFDVMARLRDDGRGLIFVSHRLEEVLTITDRVTVMREGAPWRAASTTATLSQADIIRHMVGQDLGAIYARGEAPKAAREGRSRCLEVANLASLPAVRDVSFAVAAGRDPRARRPRRRRPLGDGRGALRPARRERRHHSRGRTAPSIRGRRRRRSAPASASSPRIAARRTSSPTCR